MQNYEPKYLVMVTPDNHNKYYKMMPDNVASKLHVEFGRVGAAPQHADYPLSQFDKKYNEKIKKGYKDRTHLMADAIAIDTATTPFDEYKPIDNANIAAIVEKLRQMAKDAIKKNYTISSEAVTEAMVDTAQEIIDKLLLIKTVAAFNESLQTLFVTIPRKMNHVEKFLATSKDDFNEIIQREQSLLDVMRGQVIKPTAPVQATTTVDDRTILEANGLVFEECTDEDIKAIKKALNESAGKFSRAWKVTNLATQARFDKFVKDNGIKTTKLLFHGSRNENWWSILRTGLVLRPANAVITGKMFGYGTYFAPKAQKSIGYTSLSGSYWAGGSSSVAYMGLMEVAYGKPYDVYNFDSKYYDFNYKKLQDAKPGANCLHAHAGNMLRNDEIVIYKEEQCTVKYLVEIKN